jgi:hypothetical protein
MHSDGVVAGSNSLAHFLLGLRTDWWHKHHCFHANPTEGWVQNKKKEKLHPSCVKHEGVDTGTGSSRPKAGGLDPKKEGD